MKVVGFSHPRTRPYRPFPSVPRLRLTPPQVAGQTLLHVETDTSCTALAESGLEYRNPVADTQDRRGKYLTRPRLPLNRGPAAAVPRCRPTDAPEVLAGHARARRSGQPALGSRETKRCGPAYWKNSSENSAGKRWWA